MFVCPNKCEQPEYYSVDISELIHLDRCPCGVCGEQMQWLPKENGASIQFDFYLQEFRTEEGWMITPWGAGLEEIFPCPTCKGISVMHSFDCYYEHYTCLESDHTFKVN